MCLSICLSERSTACITISKITAKALRETVSVRVSPCAIEYRSCSERGVGTESHKERQRDNRVVVKPSGTPPVCLSLSSFVCLFVCLSVPLSLSLSLFQCEPLITKRVCVCQRESVCDYQRLHVHTTEATKQQQR